MKRATQIVEVFADVSCPFTHVALRRVSEQREQRGRTDIVLRIRAWPLELVDGEPPTGDLVAEGVRALRESVAPDLFEHFDQQQLPGTTIPALVLVNAAYQRGDQVGEELSYALRTAMFEEGRDVADPNELGRLARAFDVDIPSPGTERSVRDDWEIGKQRGVQGSPHFFVDDQGFYCPTLDITHVDGNIEVTVDMEAFSEFLEAVFGE